MQSSILLPGSSVGPLAKVSHSLLGEGSHVSSGECISSLVGRLVGFHHQSLLISAYWPEGRGNVGYGANVGSNHTGRLPDQEIRAGEGVFYGLGCCVKFPANFQGAPYSIIASGTVCLPQKNEMPFSLISTPVEAVPGLSPGINEIFPGWVLSDSVFTVVRNEAKFRDRLKKISGSGDPSIFRLDIFEKIASARDALAKAVQGRLKTQAGEAVFTEREIPEIGKNFLRESVRVKALKCYSEFLEWFALGSLWRAVNGHAALGSFSSNILFGQNLEISSIPVDKLSKLFEKFTVLHDKLIVKAVEESKRKDDKRASAVIGESYAKVHPKATEQSVVKTARSEGLVLTNAIKEWRSKL